MQCTGPGAEYLIKVMAWDGQRLGQPGAIYATTSQGRDDVLRE